MVKVSFLAQHLELYSKAELQYVAKVYIVVYLIKIISSAGKLDILLKDTCGDFPFILMIV